MKLRASHLFVILIGILLLSSVLGSVVREGMTNTPSIQTTNEKLTKHIMDNNIDNVDEKVDEVWNDITESKWWNEVTGDDIPSSNTKQDKIKQKKHHGQYIGPAGDIVDTYSNNENMKKHTTPSANDMYPSYNRQEQTPQQKTQGIPRSQIPAGQEDLYILKSQVVPPVCPACPPVIACPQEKECPPCRPCGRCPEPSFECKKVPNYDAGMKNEYLPRPILADFSQFGM